MEEVIFKLRELKAEMEQAMWISGQRSQHMQRSWGNITHVGRRERRPMWLEQCE